MIKLILTGIFIFVNLSCSSKRTDIVTFELKPQKPVVITGDFTLKDSQGNVSTITAPWFHFYINMTNNTSDTVTIVTLKGKITSASTKDGSINYESKEFAFDTTGSSLKRSYIVELKAGVQNQALDIPFYVSSLPKGDEKTFRYSGYFEFVGWVGTHDDAKSRLVTYPVYFSTE
jgi:hypothetical protein